MVAMVRSEAGPLLRLPEHRRAPFLHAGFWRRVGAWIIDWVILSAILWMLAVALGAWWVPVALIQHPSAMYLLGIVYAIGHPWTLAVMWLYFALSESSRWQATVGKIALGLQVTDLDGRRIGFGRATGRFFGMFLSCAIFFLGFLMAGWTPRKQALHDLVAGCCVVRKGALAAWKSGGGAPAPGNAGPVVAGGMPGWGVGLIVLVGLVFLAPAVARILVTVAVPAWESYSVRAEVAEGIDLTRRPRVLIAEYIGQRGALPGSNAELGLPQPEAIRARYVTSVEVTGGKVVVTYGNEADRVIRGGHVVVSPSGNVRRLAWRCSSPDIRNVFLPSDCRH